MIVMRAMNFKALNRAAFTAIHVKSEILARHQIIKMVAMRNGFMPALFCAARNVRMIIASVKGMTDRPEAIDLVLIILQRTLMNVFLTVFTGVMQMRFACLVVMVDVINVLAVVPVLVHDRSMAACGPVLVFVILMNGMFFANDVVAFCVTHGNLPSCSWRGIKLPRIFMVLKLLSAFVIVHDSNDGLYHLIGAPILAE